MDVDLIGRDVDAFDQRGEDGTLDKPFLVDDARQRLIDEVDRIRARKERKGE